MRLASIDPGLKGMSSGLWLDGQLYGAVLYPFTKHDFADRYLYEAAAGCQIRVDEVVIEQMVHYPGKVGAREAAVANDLINLTAAACLLAGKMQPRTVRFLSAKKWKGSVPKEIIQRRVEAALSARELEVLRDAISAVPKSLAHNLWDAVGLGLADQGRL